jgi:DNA-binding SARP family transcriptional activator
MIFVNIGVLVLVAGGAWWLTGFDKTAGGESKRTYYVFRTIRCAAILWLAGVFLWFVEDRGGGLGAAVLLMIIPPALALLLRSSVAEVLTHGFLQFIDPNLHDDRALDPGKSRRYLDTIGHLIQNGRRDEAVRLCEEFKQSGEVDLATLQMTLEFLGVPQKRAPVPKPLTAARQLRAEGKFAAAEERLQSLLAKNPADSDAAMLLVRLYAQDFRQPGKAQEVLRKLEKQPHAVASHIEFARRSIEEWSKPKSAEAMIAAVPESVDELLAQGFFGTAIEKLEAQAQAEPEDFDARLKLAEVHAVRCKDFHRAEKIIRQLESGSNFTPQQIESARAKLKEWREARPPHEA